MDLLGGHERLARDPKDYIKRLLSLVWPSFTAPLGSPSGLGRGEILSLLVLSVVRTYIMDVGVGVMRKFHAAVYQRDSKQFMAVAQGGVALATAAALLNSVITLCRERLAVLWREKLTSEVHRKYFANMNYYYVGTTKKPKAIHNIDDLATREVVSVTTRLVTLVALLTKSFPPIIWFTYKLYRSNGFYQAMLPHLYLVFAYEAAQRLFPKNIGILWRNKTMHQGAYSSAIARIQQNAEAISALDGQNVETAILGEQYEKVSGAAMELHKTVSKREMIVNVAYIYGCRSWIQSFVLLPVLDGVFNSTDALVHYKSSTELMWEMLIANGDLLTLHATGQHMRPQCKQLCEMLDTLTTLTAQHSSQQATCFENSSDQIAFKNVNVYAPSGQLLVHNLSFEVRKGRSLLLTGHNGAGKSSIFRCLGGLWPLREGVITKPNMTVQGDDFVSEEIFYVPQKPYNVLGTLIDQLTYPKLRHTQAADTDHIDEAKQNVVVIELLELVDLVHLMDADGHWKHDVVDWEEKLSLGEQQRLAMARLFYHKPAFAILDECTSAVTSQMERSLYRECIARSITYITICHRPSLKQYHYQNLHLLGEGSNGGWELHELPPPTLGADEDDAKESTAPKSTCRKNDTVAVSVLKKRGFFSKMYMLLKIVLPGSRRQTATLVFFILLRVYMVNLSAVVTGKLLKAALKKDRSLFAKYALMVAAQDMASAFFESSVHYLQNTTSVTWHDNLAQYAQKLFMRNNNFYTTKYVDGRIQDVDQRLSQEIFDLSEHLSAVFTKSIQPLASAAFLGVRLQSLVQQVYAADSAKSGRDTLIWLYVYITTISTLVKYFMPDHDSLVKLEKKLEARFKFIHNRLRTHSESIAFFGGGSQEKEIADGALSDVVTQQLAARKTECRFKFLSLTLLKDSEDHSSIISTSYIVNLFFQLQIAMKAGTGSNAVSPELMHVLSDCISRSIESFGKLAGLFENFSKLGASSSRVCEAFDLLSESSAAAKGGEVRTTSDVNEIVFENVDIITPTGNNLAGRLSLKLGKGESLLVTGPNGVGKTSFFRVLAGMWKARPHSKIATPKDGVSLVPQKLYTCTGSLAAQVVYPLRLTGDAEEKKKIMRCLDLVGIKRLATRERKQKVFLGKETIDKLKRLKGELEQNCRVKVTIEDSDYLMVRGSGSGCDKAVAAMSEHAEMKVEVLEDEDAGLEKVAKWDQTLSLGEQQRLAIARILYHAPPFAVLDECTDAVSVDVEKDLYRKINENGTTCITISKRLALPEFHSQQLKLGMTPTRTHHPLSLSSHTAFRTGAENPTGWELSEICTPATEGSA